MRGAEGPMGEEVRGRCSAMGASGEEGEACGGEGPRRGDLDGGDVVHSRGGGGGGRGIKRARADGARQGEGERAGVRGRAAASTRGRGG